MAKKSKKRKRRLPKNAWRFVKRKSANTCPTSWQGRHVKKIKNKRGGFVCAALPK